MTITNYTDLELKLQAEVAELDEKLKYITLAFSEWIEKTQWVQDTIQPGELGMHRADVIKSRFDSLKAKLAEVSMTTAPNPRVIELYDSHWLRR